MFVEKHKMYLNLKQIKNLETKLIFTEQKKNFSNMCIKNSIENTQKVKSKPWGNTLIYVQYLWSLETLKPMEDSILSQSGMLSLGTQTRNAGKDVVNKAASIHCWWEYKLVQSLCQSISWFPKRLNIEVPEGLAVSLLGTNSVDLISYYGETWKPILSFLKAQPTDNSNYPSSSKKTFFTANADHHRKPQLDIMPQQTHL